MEYHIVPIMHPAAIQRGQWAQEPHQVAYLETALRLSREGPGFLPNMEEPHPLANLYPTTHELWKFYQQATSSRDMLSTDVECAGPHLVCVGFARASDEAYICIRFRRQGGGLWEAEELEERAKALFYLLADERIPLLFQNGQAFDIPYLEKLGYVVEGYADDTMLRAHVTYAEHPKDLETLAKTYAGMPGWKAQINTGDQEEGK